MCQAVNELENEVHFDITNELPVTILPVAPIAANVHERVPLSDGSASNEVHLRGVSDVAIRSRERRRTSSVDQDRDVIIRQWSYHPRRVAAHLRPQDHKIHNHHDQVLCMGLVPN